MLVEFVLVSTLASNATSVLATTLGWSVCSEELVEVYDGSLAFSYPFDVFSTSWEFDNEVEDSSPERGRNEKQLFTTIKVVF